MQLAARHRVPTRIPMQRNLWTVHQSLRVVPESPQMQHGPRNEDDSGCQSAARLAYGAVYLRHASLARQWKHA